MESIRVLVGVGEPLVREGLRAVLTREGWDCACVEDDADAVLSALSESDHDVVIFDAELNRSEPKLIPSLRDVDPDVSVLVRVDHDEEECVLRSTLADPEGWTLSEGALPLAQECCLLALENDARGCIPRGANADRIVDAVRSVARGEVSADEWVLARWARRRAARGGESDAPDRLTPREVEVTQLVANGLSNKAVAARLDVKEQTVKNHLASVMRKLGARNRVEVALKARKRHLA